VRVEPRAVQDVDDLAPCDYERVGKHPTMTSPP
jgi:hypothetical protein